VATSKRKGKKIYHTTPYELSYVTSPDSIWHERAYCQSKNHQPSSIKDIKRRIGQAKRAFKMKRQLLCSKKIELQTRKQCVKTFVWSEALYGSEAWTIGKIDQKRLEVFKTWCWRRMLKI
jgi:hypothetical protein